MRNGRYVMQQVPQIIHLLRTSSFLDIIIVVDNSLKPPVLIAFLGIVVIGGTNFVAVRFSNSELAPFWGAGLRFGLASLILFAIVSLKHISLPKGRALLGAILYGILGFGVPYAFLYLALLQVSAGFASVIMSLLPLMTIFLAFVHGLERITPRAVFGGLITICGFALLFQDQLGISAQIPYILAMVAGALASAESAIVVKKFPESHPLVTNAVGMLVGAAILLVLSLITRESLTLPSLASTWIALLYLTVIGSISLFTLYLFVLSKWKASTTSYSIVLMPIVATFVSAWLEKTSITGMFLISSALVVTGVYIGAFSKLKDK